MNRNSLALFASFAFMAVLFFLSITPQPIPASTNTFTLFVEKINEN